MRKEEHLDMYVSFLRMTPGQLERATSDEAWALGFFAARFGSAADPADQVDLHRSWAGLDHLAKLAGVPIGIGDGGRWLSEYDFHGDLWGWSPAEVADAASTLSATPFDALAVHHDAEELTRRRVYRYRTQAGAYDLDTLRRRYEALREFFVGVAADGHAAMRYFG